MRMLIATPVVPEEPTQHEDEWDMLMADLRDDVPRIADMPSFRDTQMAVETIDGCEAFSFRFDVDDDLGNQLLSSAYANCPDLIIRQEA